MSHPSYEGIFRSHHPRGTIEERGAITDSHGYFVVFAGPGVGMWSGIGLTRAGAWADACERCKLTAVKEPDTRTATERIRDAEAERADVEYDRRVVDKITG